MHRRALGTDLGGGDVDAPQGDADRAGHGEPGVAVDARARVPAAVAPAVVDPDGQQVGSRAVEVRAQVVREGGVAVGVEPEVDAVEPDVGVLVDAVEAQLRVFRVEFEVPAVPAEAADGVAGRAAVLAARGVERTDLLRGRGPGRVRVLEDEQRGVAGGGAVRGAGVGQVLDAPVVREVQRAPGGVVVRRLLRAVGVAAQEEPARVEGPLARHPGSSGRRPRRRQADLQGRRRRRGQPEGLTSGHSAGVLFAHGRLSVS